MFKLVDSACHLGDPGDVVMAEHYPFRVACGAAGVNQGAALVYCNPSQPFCKIIIFEGFAMSHQVLRRRENICILSDKQTFYAPSN